MRYDDLDIMAIQLMFIMGAFCLGAVLGSRDAKRLPPPDPRALRTRCDY